MLKCPHGAGVNQCHVEGCAHEYDPVDDYYKPLTREERDKAVRGEFPPYGEMLGWIRRWEATVRAAEAKAGE